MSRFRLKHLFCWDELEMSFEEGASNLLNFLNFVHSLSHLSLDMGQTSKSFVDLILGLRKQMK
jgi:hypothetical protein